MELKDKINVIIPIYNACDSYYMDCLSCFASQRGVDFEVNLIISGATKAPAIIDKFKNIIDINVHVYNDRIPPGPARQLGIDMNTCKYVYFMDIDDTIGPKTLKILRDNIGNKLSCTGYRYSCRCLDREPFIAPNGDIFISGILINMELWNKFGLKFHPDLVEGGEDSYIQKVMNGYDGLPKLIDPTLDCIYWYYYNDTSETYIRAPTYKKNEYMKSFVMAVEKLEKINAPNFKSETVTMLVLFYSWINNRDTDFYGDNITALMEKEAKESDIDLEANWKDKLKYFWDKLKISYDDCLEYSSQLYGKENSIKIIEGIVEYYE